MAIILNDNGGQDRITNVRGVYGEVGIRHRLPTNKEKVKFKAMSAKNADHKPSTDKFWTGKTSARLNLARKLMTGFVVSDDPNDNYIEIDGLKFSSDPDSPYYKSNWKDLFQSRFDGYMEMLVSAFLEITQIDNDDKSGTEDTDDGTDDGTDDADTDDPDAGEEKNAV